MRAKYITETRRGGAGPVSGPDLRERIARLYRLHPRGARAEQGRPGPDSLGQSWLAREAGVDDRTVRRWVRRGKPSRYGALIIERLEREAGIEPERDS